MFLRPDVPEIIAKAVANWLIQNVSEAHFKTLDLALRPTPSVKIISRKLVILSLYSMKDAVRGILNRRRAPYSHLQMGRSLDMGERKSACKESKRRGM